MFSLVLIEKENSTKSFHNQIVICNISRTRHQLWHFNHQPFRRSSYISNEVVSSTTLQTQGRSIASNPIQLMDTASRIAPMRPSRFLEEKKWPPLETVNNHHWKIKRFATNIIPNITGSQSAVHQFGTTPASLRPSELSFGDNTRIRDYSFGDNTRIRDYLSNSDEHQSYSNRLKVEFDPPFRIEVTLGLMKMISACSSICFSFLHHS